MKYVGSISAGENTLLITYDKWVSSYNKYDVYAALVHSPYNIEKITVAETSNYVYDEYSNSAWVPGWSKYVIIYWNSSDKSTYAVTLSEDGTLGSRLKIVKDWGY